jgi:hypothetical protein
MLLNSNERQLPRSNSRVRKFVFSVFVGLAVVAIAAVLGYLHISHDTFVKWGGLGIGTAVLFWNFIVYSKSFVRRWSFWTMIVGLLLAHLAIFIVVLLNISEWKFIWFMVMLFEFPIFVFLRNKLETSS